MAQIVSRKTWKAMLLRSEDLLERAQKAITDHERAIIWAELQPLNRLIRSNNLLVEGIDVSTDARLRS